MSEHDIIPDGYLFEEAVGHEPEAVPMTEFQEYYLKTEIDPMIDRLIANLEAEKQQMKQRDENFKSYVSRTNDYQNYYSNL